MADSAHLAQPSSTDGQTRRDFLLYATTAVGVAGTGLALWPFVHSMNPAADTLALSTTDVDLAALQPGQAITVVWQGKPVFVRHRTPEEIEKAVAEDAADLRDPQKDADRVQKPEWLIVIGVCTHLGCVPLGQKPADPKGDYAGWFCPCHGSHYDTSGRIRKGPAPLNLPVPPYAFTGDTTIRIG
ncbi:MAG: ubiquinol-cytochrome c reductase iron-sulfur subunit [Pseudomonadota bacterium]